MSEDTIVISWWRLAWHMLRHLCGPDRAIDIELARRYDRARGHHLPRAVRAARLRSAPIEDD